MPNEIRLNKQAGAALKSKIKLARGYLEEEEGCLAASERLAAGLHYGNMAPCLREARRGAADALYRLEALSREYGEYERAIEEFDRESARLLNGTAFTMEKNTPLDSVFVGPPVMADPLPNKMPLSAQGADLAVRAIFESRGCTVEWNAADRTISVSKEGEYGGPLILREGIDFYIKNDRAYFYNNLRAIMEAKGIKVDYAKTPGGGSAITLYT
ncbi:MAG: copper amine oxidase N-terminal domain-containing protein, partial [Clostridiales bacterium]|nr:copper amine oxidase N-terminal domain-containing protein [Clostridiales bacterium]